MALKGMCLPFKSACQACLEFQLNLGTSLEITAEELVHGARSASQMAEAVPRSSHGYRRCRIASVGCRTLQVHLNDCECLHENFLRSAAGDMRISTDARILAVADRDLPIGKSISRPL